MNKLPVLKRVQILSMLVEGSSLRSTSRVCGVSINTVTKLLVDAGTVCAAYHDKMVRKVDAKRIQADEIWSFCYAKERNVKTAKAAPDGSGSVWTWTAIDPDSKLMVSWWVGDRSSATGFNFLDDLQSRLADRVQLTTDGHGAYLEAVDFTFGENVDFAQLIKIYKETKGGAGRYSPAECTGTKTKVVSGNPNADHISTSHAERQNLTMRMSMRRFTRLTNAFSKKFENHCHSLALYFVFYNWMRKHKAHGKTPAMAAGLTDKALTMADLVEIIDAREMRVIQGKRHAILYER
ncbi:MAG: IS1 family transposase [Pseudolabrys sp.]|nr:IS1 family transposase [Pseudolabrys sp.]